MAGVFQVLENQTLRAAASLAAATTQTAFLNLVTGGPLEATILVASTPGASVAAGAQLTVNVLVSTDGGSTYSTVPQPTIAIPSVASTLASVPITLAGGKRYRLDFINTDASNAIPTVSAIYSQISSIG